MGKNFSLGRLVISLCLAASTLLVSWAAGQEQTSTGKTVPVAGTKSASASTAQPAEDWTKLKVGDTSLVMKRPELAERDDIPNSGFIRDRYEANWRNHDLFDLYVIRPKGTAKVPVILYIYSMPEDTDQFKNNHWCETAVSGGYAAVGFVGAVTGHRTRFRPLKEWFVSEMPEALGGTVHDVQLILDFLTTRSDLDLERVGIFASGSGAAIAIMASAVDPRIHVLDLLGPWGDWPKWTAESKIIPNDERANYVKPDFLAKVKPLDPVDWLPKVQAKAVRIQDIRGNKSVPDDAEKSLEAAAPDFAMINEFGNGRAFLANGSPISLFDWIKEQVKTDGQSQVTLEKSERIHFYPALEAPPQAVPNVGALDTTKPPAAAKPVDGKQPDNPKAPPNADKNN